jgi:hypothetical protein
VTELLDPLGREPLPQYAHERPEGTHLLAPPEKGPDADQKFFGNERLGHIVVGPPLQPLHPVLDLGLLREHDYGDLGSLGVLAERPEHIQAITPRHEDVQQDQVGGRLPHALHGLDPVCSPDDTVARLLQDHAHELAEGGIVVSQKDLRVHDAPSSCKPKTTPRHQK